MARDDGVRRLHDSDEVRGDLDNPVVAMQMELQTVLDRYPEIRRSNPEYLITLLVDMADSLRELHNLDHEVTSHGSGVHVLEVGELGAIIGAPRGGDHMDVDQDALDRLLEEGDDGE